MDAPLVDSPTFFTDSHVGRSEFGAYCYWTDAESPMCGWAEPSHPVACPCICPPDHKGPHVPASPEIVALGIRVEFVTAWHATPSSTPKPDAEPAQQ